MSSPALIREADARRLARVAKSEGVAVKVAIGEKEITIFPHTPDSQLNAPVDRREEIDL